MRSKLLIVLAVVVLVLALGSPAKADSTLQINGGAGDPNLINGSSFTVLQVSGGADTIPNLILLFSVPGVTTTGTGGVSVSSATGGGSIGTAFLAGILATSPSCNNSSNDVYSCAGFFGTNQSNNLTNLSGADSTINGITATTFGIYEVVLTGANLAAGSSTTITGIFPLGTFVDGFGTGDKVFDTPFTEAGLTSTVPEPGTLVLFGSGLLGLAGAVRRRLGV